MRVGVVRGRRTVRCPAGVGNAGKTGKVGAVDLFFQVGNARGATRTSQLAVDMQCNAARVVAAIFEAFESLQQDGSDIALRNRADDAAHEDLSLYVCECSDPSVGALKYAF
jgi:hypothetical protein